MARLNEAARRLSWFYPTLLMLFFLAVVAVTGGCAALATLPISSLVGSPNSQSMNIYGTTEVRIEQRNFMVMKTNVVGESKGFSLFGIVTLVPARVSKAMDRLYGKADMQQGRPQILANLSLEQNSSFYILFGIPRTTVRADVVEFTAPSPTVTETVSPPPETKPKTP